MIDYLVVIIIYQKLWQIIGVKNSLPFFFLSLLCVFVQCVHIQPVNFYTLLFMYLRCITAFCCVSLARERDGGRGKQIDRFFFYIKGYGCPPDSYYYLLMELLRRWKGTRLELYMLQ